MLLPVGWMLLASGAVKLTAGGAFVTAPEGKYLHVLDCPGAGSPPNSELLHSRPPATDSLMFQLVFTPNQTVAVTPTGKIQRVLSPAQ